MGAMSCLGNLLWFLCCGLWQGLSWLLAGLLWCVTIVGIPIGLQCFKFASLAFFPFGKEVRYGGGTVFPASESDLDFGQWDSVGSYCGSKWNFVVLYHHWHSVRVTVF